MATKADNKLKVGDSVVTDACTYRVLELNVFGKLPKAEIIDGVNVGIVVYLTSDEIR